MADEQDKRVFKRKAKVKLPGKKPIPGAKNEVKSDVVMDKVSSAEDEVEGSEFPRRDLTDEELMNLADMVLSFSQKMCGITLYPYEAELGFRIIYSLLAEDSEEISALYSRQSGKCLLINTPVMMYDGSIRSVQDILVGDELMGGDGVSPRKVLSLSHGFDHMYRVQPSSSLHNPYTVNQAHILTVQNRATRELVDIPLEDLRKLDSISDHYRGVRIRGEYSPENQRIENQKFSFYKFSIIREYDGEYFGFTLDGDGRFLLGDGTVTHNTETISVVVCGAMVMLPVLATALPWESRISKFSNGLWCGVYAPVYEQAGIMWKRMKLRLYSKSAKEVLLDPDINIDLSRITENMTLPNGSFVDCGTASPQSHIEGKTYHLAIIDESQDVSAFKLRASIGPMLASTGGTLVKIGTPSIKKSDFYEVCRRNKRNDVSHGRLRHRVRNHFEYDYTVVQQYNDRYRKYVTKERERLGEDSDEFRMKYRLHWILERGMFINADLFDECGIKKPNQNLFTDVKNRARKSKRGRPVRINFSRPINTVNYDVETQGQVAAIDVGKANSTVVTVGKVFWDGPVQFGEEQRFPIHVLNWLELHGDDHEAQHEQIMSFLKNYRLQSVIVDATGKGDPVYDRIAAELDKYGIYAMPFLFSTQSKDIMYKILLQELQNRRVTYPAGPAVVRLSKWQRFYNQMVDLEKKWHGQRMIVSKSADDNAARDDFCDSLAMLCYLVNAASDQDVEMAPNPLIGRAAKWEISETMKQAGAWFRRAVNPRGSIPTTRPSKSGKWEAQ